MSIIKVVKTAFLFIGTVIGAGFGTGKELTSFFFNSSPITLILGGLAMGVFCSFYLYIGSKFSEDLSVVAFSKYSGVFDFLVLVSTFAVFSAMFSTSDSILNLFSIKYGGYITMALSLVAALIGIGFVKNINFVVVPLIVVVVFYLFSMEVPNDFNGRISVLSPILYSAMNIMLAGYLIANEGKGMTKKEVATSGLIVFVVMAVLMTILYMTVRNEVGEMPLLDVANRHGHIKMAGVVIYFAIVTTALSSASLGIEKLNRYVKNRYLSAILLFFLAIPVKIFVGFEGVVKYVYPAVSVMGILVTLLAFIALIRKRKNENER